MNVVKCFYNEMINTKKKKEKPYFFTWLRFMFLFGKRILKEIKLKIDI